MRSKLFVNPALLLERVAYWARQQRRLKRLRGTLARELAIGHIESLELLEHAKPQGIKVIYDVGASVGTWALLAKAIIPEATIEAFEPLPAHCLEFEKNLRTVEGVRLHTLALGAERASKILRVTDFSDASSMLSIAAAGCSQFGANEVSRVQVEMQRLDDYRGQQGLPFPDLMKLDVQGYEVEVLKGASECLSHVKAVVVEVSFSEYYEEQCSFHELVAHLAKFRLFLAALGDHTPTGKVLAQADALFLRTGEYLV
jgi:FkbM family methyltransferase